MTTPFTLGDVRRGGLFALGAALLFGLSTPAAKAITGNVPPLLLAGLLYLGSGLGLTLWRALRRLDGLRLEPGDMRWLAAAVLFGGALGPALLMWGLTRTSGSVASLLLTLEGVFTALLAWIVFGEPFNRRIGFGMAGDLRRRAAARASRPDRIGRADGRAGGGRCLRLLGDRQ